MRSAQVSITVRPPYTGSVISVNHYRYPRSPHLLPEAKKWQGDLTLMVRAETNRVGAQFESPVHIRLTGRYRNKRLSCDYDNLHKVIGDAIEAAIGINDKEFRWQNAEPEYGVQQPEIVIEIWS